MNNQNPNSINNNTGIRNDDATSEQATSVYGSGSFGPRLKQARKQKSITIDGVAKELFILPRHIEALEEEDFEALPELAFSRGFVVNYAKFLDLDPDPLVDSFNQSYPDHLKKQGDRAVTSPLKPLGPVQRESKRSFGINPLLIIGAIALIVLAVFLLRMVLSAQNSVSDADDVVLIDELSDSEQDAGAAISINRQSDFDTDSTGTASGSALDLNNAGSAIETNVVSEEFNSETAAETTQ